MFSPGETLDNNPFSLSLSGDPRLYDERGSKRPLPAVLSALVTFAVNSSEADSRATSPSAHDDPADTTKNHPYASKFPFFRYNNLVDHQGVLYFLGGSSFSLSLTHSPGS